jgi:hypothetical protein
MTQAISSHGTLIARAPGGGDPLDFTDIAELGDIAPPALTRNEFDATTQDKDIDSYVLGVLRRGAMTVPINFLPTNGTHDHLTGLYKAMIDNSIDGYRITFPDDTEWVLSGQVQNIEPTAPVDGKLSAEVTIRFTGAMMIDGVVIGA